MICQNSTSEHPDYSQPSPLNRPIEMRETYASGPSVAVVIVNYNGTADTIKCLAAMADVAYDNFRVIVVDNGSSPSAADEISAAYPEVHVIRSEQNGGWAGGNNLGIRHAREFGVDYVLLLNNDTIVAPRLLSLLTEAAATHPDYGILGSVVCYMDEPDVVNMDGCLFDDADDAGFFCRQPVPVTESKKPNVVETDIVFGCCMLIDVTVFDQVGLIDERFFLIHEESEFCLRARDAGFRSGIVADVLVWHKGSSSFQRESKPLQRYFDARNLYLLLKTRSNHFPSRKSRRRAWRKYIRHVYYMYCLQLEQDNRPGAEAVLQGFSDGLRGHFGPMVERRRLLVPFVRRVFDWWHTRRSNQKSLNES